MARVLVVGGGGFIGAHLVRRLLDDGAEVTVADAWRSYGVSSGAERERTLAWRAQRLLAGADVRSLSIEDGDGLCELLLERAPEVVVQLADLPLAQRAFERPEQARSEIVGSTEALLSALDRAPRLRHIVYVSSSMVYGDFDREPMPEHAPCRPREPYGRFKYAAEHLVRAHGARAGHTVTVVRPSAVYGPGDLGGRFIQRLVDAARHGTTLTLTGAAATRLDFTFVEDLAEGLLRAALHPSGSAATFNMTYGEGRSLAEAVAIVRDLGHDVTLEEAAERTSFRPRRGTLDISRARRALGYHPRHPLERGLARYLAVAQPVAA
jgi:UDP-glucose 4-epimerase